MIPVTKTFLPPKEEYAIILNEIWKSNQIANGGDLHGRLASALKSYFNISNLILTANGTLPLQIALKSLANQGEVITTPFSYVATVSSIVWENCIPVFVDIHPDFLTIDETLIENAITDNTTAILATHVFGNPCNIGAIQQIANKFNLKVIYDAAHCFGVKFKGKSVFHYGDVSTCSFHATKIFHTGEGGAMFCNQLNLHEELFYRHNFGHNGPEKFYGLGINAKMSELQAAMGLAVIPYFDSLVAKRKKLVELYDAFLDFKNVSRINLRPETEWNYSYYPIIFKTESELLQTKYKLEKAKIFPRRYFYPSLNKLPYLENISMDISEKISKTILCLPLYDSLTERELTRICGIINN